MLRLADRPDFNIAVVAGTSLDLLHSQTLLLVVGVFVLRPR